MNKKLQFFTLLLVNIFSISSLQAAIDMQAHLATDEAQNAYTSYLSQQSSYYTGNYTYTTLLAQTGDQLFGSLNTLMGNTCKLEAWGLDYGDLRYAYTDVDRDLNKSGNIIGYYDGYSFDGKWDSGNTWNREHTWPQSKGANKDIPMGHDMQSVRPTRKAANSDRGNTAYGEGGSYYDPDDEISINNSAYKKINLGTYRGDAARVIMYDYIVYGQAGSYKNSLYNGNAQLLNKLGSSGVFESLRIMLKWHMQDPPSLTEMVRNDGAQAYQGNRNPFIDFPEFAIQIFLNNSNIKTHKVKVNTSATLWPNYQYTLSDGFIAYLTEADGSRPESVDVTGATYSYDATMGRLTITNVTSDMVISTNGITAIDDIYYSNKIVIYNITGTIIAEISSENLSSTLQTLPSGLYIIQQGNQARKIMR